MAKKSAKPPSPPTPSAQQLPRTLGPVSDLERHLPSEWWRNLFNSVYIKTDADVVENDANTSRDVDQLIEAANLKSSDAILDLCCGQGRHTLELARRGFRRVAGLDRSRYLIRLARRRARKESLNVTFHEGDARRFRLPENSFNCVAVMGNSFGYFERERDDLDVLKMARRVLKPGGFLALDVVDGAWMRQHFEKRSWEWIDQNHFVCRERSLASDGQRLISREVVVHAERGVIVDQFYAERLYSEEQLRFLLEEAGFKDICPRDGARTESTREQDLGMMARRMLFSARAPEAPAVVPGTKPVPAGKMRVTVLMGDPRLPDAVKRGGQFNPEDFDTINRLKAALNQVEGYEYSYLDNHAELFDRLRDNPPDMALNLCDEGYRNDAFQELHVPAMLDALGIHYTGAGPACLGMCYNKSLVRAVAAALDIPTPLETYFDPNDQSATLPATFPALIKPNYGDSSVGIDQRSIVRSPEELMARMDKVREELPGRALLIQEFLEGDEYGVAVVGNPGMSCRILPVMQVDYSRLPPDLPKILGYESKWLPDTPYWSDIRYREAEVDDETLRKLQDHSMLLFERLGCRDYARFDYRADSRGRPKLLEVNPNPGWCWDGKLNMMAEMAGLTYADLLRLILDAARERLTSQQGEKARRANHATAAALASV
jgi:D-alanine-D-alanine ligase